MEESLLSFSVQARMVSLTEPSATIKQAQCPSRAKSQNFKTLHGQPTVVGKPSKLNMRNGKKPLVSIAMCTYNGEPFLKDQLDSLLAQDYSNLEIIIVDDHSQDSTAGIIREYEEKDSRIIFHQNSQQLGFVRNFEKAITLTTGTYVALCDQDDIWMPHKISDLCQNIGSSSLIYSKTEIVDVQGKRLNLPFPKGVHRISGRSPLALLLANCVTGHACMIERDLITKALPIPAGVKMHDHWIACVAAAEKGIKAYSSALSLYRQHGENSVLGKKGRDTETKLQKIARKHRERLAFIQAFSNITTLTENERIYVERVRKALVRQAKLTPNYQLRKALLSNGAPALKIFEDPQKHLEKLTRSLILSAIT